VRNGSQSLSPERAESGKLDAATDDLVPRDAQGIPSMRDRPFGLLSVLLMLVVAPPLTAQSLPDQAVKRLEASISQTMRDQKIPGFAIGIVKDGRLAYSGGFGVMRVGYPDARHDGRSTRSEERAQTRKVYRVVIKVRASSIISRLLLDRGIRPDSNTCSGDPSEIADGGAKAHMANPGRFKVPSREGESWKRHSCAGGRISSAVRTVGAARRIPLREIIQT
jgi:hypothetical protein